MNTSPNAMPSRSTPLFPAWYKIGALLLLVVLCLLFFFFSTARSRHRMDLEAPRGGSVPGQPGQVIAH